LLGKEFFKIFGKGAPRLVGICTISVTGIGDPTDETGKWAAVKIKPKEKFARPVMLAAIKAEPRLAEMQLVRLSRLSVCGVTPAEWQVICEMAKG
jgi:predicted RNA-binding protein with PUA-like domain